MKRLFVVLSAAVFACAFASAVWAEEQIQSDVRNEIVCRKIAEGLVYRGYRLYEDSEAQKKALQKNPCAIRRQTVQMVADEPFNNSAGSVYERFKGIIRRGDEDVIILYVAHIAENLYQFVYILKSDMKE